MFKVLVVDDDENINLFISRLLTKKFACKVSNAKNGLEALNQMRVDKPEVIFLDVTMPVMDGVETLAAIREDEELGDIPVIMLTAVSDKTIVRKVMDMGIVSYLLKPLMYDVTYEKIKELFYQIKREREEAERKKAEAEKDKPQNESVSSSKDKLLIIDTDERFRITLREQMQNSYEILEAENGAEGLEIFIKEWPAIVCIGENLPLLNEKLLSQKLRVLEKEKGKKITIFALREGDKLDGEERGLYDLVIPRSKGLGAII